MNEALSWILDTVQSVDPLVRTLLAGIAIMLETSVLVGLVVPGDSVVLVASTGVEGPVEYTSMVAVVIVGALIGESVGFAIGRWFGPRLRASRLGRRIGEKNWVRAETYLARRGGLAVFLSRFIPVLHSLIPLTVGMSPMSYRRFMTWTVPACILWAFAYVSVGSAAAGGYRELSTELHGAGYLFVAAIALFALGVFGVKKIINKVESRHMQEAPPSHVDDGEDGASTGSRDS
ncbi:DedA family protein [Herbiconiux liangxiaofengii]|uniref:DedA family protein n=1 Tax=Herbiconiux liangxiaofengii TaxID=3342795 RepID=UPI0035BA8DFA